MKFLAVDPSIRRCGLALFRGGKVGTKLIRCKSSKKEGNWLQALDEVVGVVAGVARGEGMKLVVIEHPILFGGVSQRGRAAENSKGLMKLFAFVHSLRTLLKESGVEVVLIDVGQWKGNVPKQVTQVRMKRLYGNWVDDISLDECDALGLGTWYLREIRNGNKEIKVW